MNANDIFRNSRFEKMSELKTYLAQVVQERDALRTEIEILKSHFFLAVMAAQDVMRLGDDGEFIIVDGWNAVLNNKTREHSTVQNAAKQYLASHDNVFIWIVFDGDKANSILEENGKLRVTYTGGKGDHRADRMICDFVRMVVLSGSKVKVTVHTNDKDFREEVKKIGANVCAADTLWRI